MRMSRDALLRVAGMLALCLSGTIRADVIIEQHVTTDGFGPSKLGAMEGHDTTAVTSDRARTENQIQFKSKLLRALARGANTDTVRIIRLDEELEDEIDVAQKQYTVTTFQQMRDQAHQAMQSLANQGNAPPPQQQAPTGAPVDESKCQWSPPRSEVHQTGEHATIAGMDSSRATISVTTTCTDTSSGASCDFVFLVDEWLTPDIPGAAETREFWSNYAKKLDLSGEMDRTLQANSSAVFERYKGSWGAAMKQASSLQGFPVKSIFAVQFGGPQCKSADSGANGNGNGGSSSGGSTAPTASSVPTSPSALAGNLAMNLFGKLHKKDDAPPAEAPPAGMVQLFQMTSETVSVRTETLPGGLFEVPAGFKKVEKPSPVGQ